MNIKKFILDALLTKYENSSHFRDTAKVKRGIFFVFNRQNTPEYLRGDQPNFKEAVHQAVTELEQQEILRVEWVRGEKNNLLKRVSLNLEKLSEAYRLINRVPKWEALEEIHALLQKAEKETSSLWLKNFFLQCCAELELKAVYPSEFPKDKQDLQLVLQSLRGIEEKGNEEILERIFSIRYLGNSKLFNRKAKSYLINILRKYYFQDLALTEEDVFNEIGIVKTTEEILLTGPLTVKIAGKVIDLSPLFFGAVIDTNAVEQLEIIENKGEKILLVENKTNFHYLARLGLPKNFLLIYLGGFPGPGKRKFLQKLYQACLLEKTPRNFLFWGDLDWGGIKIFQILQEKVLPNLQALYMDRETLWEFRKLGDELQPSYRTKLEKLLCNPKYTYFHQVISLMLDLNVRLEQEALLIKGNLLINDF